MTVAIWKDIPDLHGFQASNDGRIRKTKLGANGRLPRELKNHLETVTGYYSVAISRGDGTRAETMLVHRLVCKAFHGMPPLGSNIVAHHDGTRTNNVPENLRWATHTENAADMIRHGRMQHGETHGQSKLTRKNVRRIFQLAAMGVTTTEIGKIFSIHRTHARRILNGECWRRIAVSFGTLRQRRTVNRDFKFLRLHDANQGRA